MTTNCTTIESNRKIFQEITIKIDFTPKREELVWQKVTSGLYTSANYVLRKALRLCKKKDACFYARKKLVQLHCDNRDSFNSGLVANFDAKEIKWAKPPAGSRTGSLPHRYVHLMNRIAGKPAGGTSQILIWNNPGKARFFVRDRRTS